MSGIEQAAAAIERGEVVGVPTDTVYGIAVDPARPDAVERVFAVKGRPEAMALPVLVADPGDAARLAVLGESAEKLADRFWPGGLTLVLVRRSDAAAPVLHLGSPADTGTVGVRCPANEATRALLRRTGPLAVTSANVHGAPPATTPDELRAALGGAVGVVIDGGTCAGEPSTVISLTGGRPVCLREGAVAIEEIERVLDGRVERPAAK